MTPGRPDAVEPYVRGAAWPAAPAAWYPRADLHDVRLPRDTMETAMVPAGVRLEARGDATHVDVAYLTATDELGHRGAAAGTTFAVWSGGVQVDEQPARLGAGTVRLQLGGADDRAVVHLPEGMKPLVTAIGPVAGDIEPAPKQPRWVAYGDSITEGWVATGPGRSWTAIAGRHAGLDVVNMGYAGAARGELASAEHIAALDADVISLAFGTNCWSRLPFTAALMGAAAQAFLGVVRAGHPGVPIVVVSPILRPDAEAVPNAAGATLADLRQALEAVVAAASDALVTLVPGLGLLDESLLADGVHPNDDGHRVLAGVLGGAVRTAYDAA